MALIIYLFLTIIGGDEEKTFLRFVFLAEKDTNDYAKSSVSYEHEVLKHLIVVNVIKIRRYYLGYL